MGDVTNLLDRWNDGDPEALQQLIVVLYGELKRLANHILNEERRHHTLQPTALVHEAYVRLTGLREMRLDSRRHFYGAAASAMRRILVDYARQRNALKRGGADLQRVPLDEALNVPVDLRLDFERLNEALDALAVFAPERAQLVELRYFAGLSIEDTADVLGVSAATVKRHWHVVRAWLYRALDETPPARDPS
jgi:RNA polymerase sigma factor (TIGR02999 family)